MTKQNIILVTSLSNSFVNVAGVAFYSMIKNSNKSKIYKLYILDDGDISDDSKKCFLDFFETFQNFEIIFKKVQKTDLIWKNFKSRGVSNITIHTYYRLFCSFYFPEYDKVLYLDPDMIFLKDISNLYLTNIDNFHIAGVKDVNMSYFLNKEINFKNFIYKN